MDLLLFGDQTADQYALLRRAVHSKSNAVLTTFLEQVSVALREETRRLPRNRREQIPDFLRVSDLLERYYEKGNKLPELESSLVTISQLAHYIGYVAGRSTGEVLHAKTCSGAKYKLTYFDCQDLRGANARPSHPHQHAFDRLMHGAAGSRSRFLRTIS